MDSYKIKIDDISSDEWERYAGHFTDYSIYQTWPYQQVRADMDRQEVDRILVKKETGEVVAMCQVRIKQVKALGLRIGYVQWGPLVHGENGILKCPAEALRIFREAYVGDRVNVLRLTPNACNDETGQELSEALKASGFQHVKSVAAYHTMLLRLDCPEEELRKKLHQSWRRKLKKAETLGMEVKECTDEGSFAVLGRFYLELVRKRGFRSLNPHVFTETQRMLSASDKMSIVLVYHDGEPVTAHLTANLGDTAILLLVASNEKGLKCGASYLAWWKAILASRRAGMKKYDVGGIDFGGNPNVSRFKAGMGGEEVQYIGAYDAYSSIRIKSIWRVAEKVYNFIKNKNKLREILSRDTD